MDKIMEHVNIIYVTSLTSKEKLKKEFSCRLTEIYNDSKDSKIVTAEAIYNLYSYYSKYDYLSH